MKYDLEYFIAKFEEIPSEQWTSGTYLDDKGFMCAYGHCGMREGDISTKESRAIGKLILDLDESWSYTLADVNDGIGEYSKFGGEPKQRVVNYLKSLRTV